jgi:hypothetical protein
MEIKKYADEDPYGDRYYLINDGMYYLPDNSGYTLNMMEAGMFGEEYANDICQTTTGVRKELAL